MTAARARAAIARLRDRLRERIPALAALAALAVLAGCSVPPYPGAPPIAPPQATQPRASAPAAPPIRSAPAHVDTTPSPEALEVLETIPEPVSEEDRAAIPVPSETPVLGERSADVARADSIAAAADRAMAADSAAAPPGGSPPPPPSQAPRTSPDQPPPQSLPPSSGPCWRVQLAAPDTHEEAEQEKAAAASQLDIAVVIEPQGGLYKVRSAACLDRNGAGRLRERAIGAGFEGAFLVQGPAR